MDYNKVFQYGVNGWCDFQDIYDEAIRKYPNGTFVEIGSWMGMSAAYMLEKAEKEGVNIDLFCVDTFMGDPDNHNEQRILEEHGKPLLDTFLLNLSLLGFLENIHFNIIKGLSHEAHRHFSDESVDFVFIDGGHLSAQVTADLKAWWPKVKVGGMMGGHDFNSSSVKNPVLDFFGAVGASHNSWFLHKTENNMELK